jgi:hypothetical protein
MKYIDVLGEPLKSDFLCDLFETYDVDVVYSYDRTHENIEDEYFAEIADMGLSFLFDNDQKLISLFMTTSKHTGYNPFELPDPRSVPFNTRHDAEVYAKENNIQIETRASKKDSFFGEIPEWVKFHYGEYSIHYEFNGNGIRMVTLQLESA